MKKRLSLILAAAMLMLSLQTAVFAEETDDPTGAAENVTIKAYSGDRTAEITAYGDLDAVVVKASYDGGALKTIKATKAIKLKNGANTVRIGQILKEGDKLMVWDSLTGMKPYGSCTVSAPPKPIVEQHDVSYTDKLGKSINIYGRLFRPENGEKSGVIILSHGYNAYGDAFEEKCRFFANNGYAAYAFDFCGGSTKSKSTGRESTEMTLFTETEDLIAVFDYLSKLDCIDADNMFLSGDSQGGMVSALAAEELGNDKVRAMALQFPAFGIPDVWRNEEPNLPREHWGLMLGKVFATSVKDFYTFNYVGKNYTNNLLIISGTADPVVPISSVRQAVNSVYKNGKLVEFAGEGHGFSKTKEAEARQLILEFLNANSTSAN